jgi:hypothetical protein
MVDISKPFGSSDSNLATKNCTAFGPKLLGYQLFGSLSDRLILEDLGYILCGKR